MSMTDRELLELAAKANGYQVKGWVNDRLVFFNPVTCSAEETWNPLDDDGDALRLAFSLGMVIHLDEVGSIEAVRRDIVLAAAKIGKALQVKH